MGLLLTLKASAMMRGMMIFVVVLLVVSFITMAIKIQIHFIIMIAFVVVASNFYHHYHPFTTSKKQTPYHTHSEYTYP